MATNVCANQSAAAVPNCAVAALDVCKQLQQSQPNVAMHAVKVRL